MRYLVLSSFLAFAACGGSSGGGDPDASGNHPDGSAHVDSPHGGSDAQAGSDAIVVGDAVETGVCGQPGDQGNELGVGLYCTSITDCFGTSGAPLCAVLGDPNAHFCTKTCTMGDDASCGTNASCTCNTSNQCGCTPNYCLGGE
ncbi:MAG TPA: hypothetical protein VGM88_05210 [Kofleriaceae bacterium]|jgi:hypothetical protein